MQNIGQDTIKNMMLPIPPKDEQRLIVRFLNWKANQIDQMHTAISFQHTRLAEYRSALITAAVTGQIDVRGVLVPAPV